MAESGDPAAAEKSASSSSMPKPIKSPEEEIRAVARNLSDQPVPNPEPGVWAVLTAISKNARQRPQGINIILSRDNHRIGRSVGDIRFQIGEITVSGKHCRIFRERLMVEHGDQDPSISVQVFLKDTSMNGTYLNWERLRKHSPKAKLCHGDIISFIAPPHDDKAYAFVYREVHKPACNVNGASLKRKSDDFATENKRLKGIGIGAPEGPISLDDVRSLQRSNTELRQQLEAHVLTIESMGTESRASIARHENELKELKETVSNSFLGQIKDLRTMLDGKQKELVELTTLSAELQHSIKDLSERLSASMQSRSDADEIIHSQKASISELETQLDEQRNQRREEREKAAADLKSALQKAQSEAQEEIKRQAENYLRQHREQQEVINKLQETEKESRLLVGALRSKLEDARESLVISEKRVRHLEVQIQDEQAASASTRKKSEALELELTRLRNELNSEKIAREEAWAKVSALELEIAAAIRDLSIEKQRFQGARERIILRETQLRAFYSTTEEISALFAKQHEQLKAMQRTLEDEEDRDTVSIGLNIGKTVNANLGYDSAQKAYPINHPSDAPGASTLRNAKAMSSSSMRSDDASITEKHNCNPQSPDGNTQDLEFTSADKSLKGFGSDIDGVGSALVPDGLPAETERVLETESQACDAGLHGQNAATNKCINMTGDDMMQLDDEACVQEDFVPPIRELEGRHCPVSESKLDEDTDPGTIRTADLLASEVAGSWAVSTAPSVHGENESPKSQENTVADEEAAATALLLCSEGQAAGSQNDTVCGSTTKLHAEYRALNAMIEIVAPDFKQRFQDASGGQGERNDSLSDAETEGSNHSDASDNDIENARHASDNNDIEGETQDYAQKDGDEMIEDSVG
ncbi:TSC-22 / Dip / Bun protein [Dioscorea alata]|uniref:TSC-22 / Dip / Bun protein n=1 Tax=Dioscorea alata TaxID=55571 RepID=A0ACB7UVJ3_DIOAL|nr:TSC-22 / Dip / Bun protein [Dioscorea alata]